jgi:multiple sugar transport system permease protein
LTRSEAATVDRSSVAAVAARAAERRRDLIGYAFLAPWLIGFLVFSLGPVLASLYLSFTRFDLLRPAVWVGADN